MAAEEWVVLIKMPDSSYREVFTPQGVRPVVEKAFEALEAVDPQMRGPEMYTAKASQVDTWILIPEGDRPSAADLVKVLPDGSLQRVRNQDSSPVEV